MKIINSMATVKALNVKKEGPGDLKVVALDIKVSGAQLRAEFVGQLLGCDDIAQRLWDEAGDPAMLGIEHIQSWAEVKGVACSLEGIDLEGDLKKFRLVPRGMYLADADFVIHVTDPGRDTTSLLAQMVGEEVDLTAERTQAELDINTEQAA